MKAVSVHSLSCSASQTRAWRGSTILRVALAVVLAASIGIMPARAAFADQTLELPAAVAHASYQPESIDGAGAESQAAPPATAPMPEGLGSVDDYENQGESSYPAGIANSPSNLRIDPHRNRDSLVKDVVLGALVIGLFALEARAAQQHRNR